eukprot:GHVT01031903.1.p1 GENE.GHVT01031903.1~~GHVT01031903.1.p1  ORF type:complete len:354 (-),score=86.70 GHVT01031903.1:1541-2602(-)
MPRCLGRIWSSRCRCGVAPAPWASATQLRWSSGCGRLAGTRGPTAQVAPAWRRRPWALASLMGGPRTSVASAAGRREFAAAAAAPEDTYDVAVIGGGPGGYVAAIKAAQLGMKTVCVEKRGALGGTCLNEGCIPSKALLNISHKFHEASHSFAKMGINVNAPSLDVATMMTQKDKAVTGLTQGIEFLFKKNKVAYVKGEARLTSGTTIEVSPCPSSSSPSSSSSSSPTRQLSASSIIIATGSEISELPGGLLRPDEQVVVSSRGALSLAQIPRRLVVVGGGVIGLELGSVWQRLGADVTVVEFLDRICPALDGEVSRSFQRILAKQGMKFLLHTRVADAAIGGTGATLTLGKG